MANVILDSKELEALIRRERDKDLYIARLEKANAFLNKQILEYNIKFAEDKK
jgi:hypothetical protein